MFLSKNKEGILIVRERVIPIKVHILCQLVLCFYIRHRTVWPKTGLVLVSGHYEIYNFVYTLPLSSLLYTCTHYFRSKHSCREEIQHFNALLIWPRRTCSTRTPCPGSHEFTILLFHAHHLTIYSFCLIYV